MKWFDDVKKYYVFRGLNKRFVIPVWVVVMLDGGLSVQEIALIAIVSSILNFILEVPSGTISDSIGHKQALIISMLGQGAGMLFFLGGSFWWMLAGSLTYWGMGTLMSGTHQALFYERLVELKRGDEYQKLMGRARAVSSLWSMVTVAFTGLVYAWSPTVTFVIGAMLFWIGAIVVNSMSEAKRETSVKEREGFSQLAGHFREAFRTLRSSKKLFWLTVSSSTILGAAWGMGEFQQVILEDIGLALSLFGVFYAMKRLFAAATAPFLHRIFKRISAPSIVTLMAISVTAYCLLAGMVTNHVAILFVALCISAPFVIHSVVVNGLLNDLIPTGSRATTLSMGMFVHNVAKIAVMGAVGALSAVLSIGLTHIMIGVLMALVFFFMLPMTYRAYR